MGALSHSSSQATAIDQSVYFSCHHFLVSMPTRRIERLVLHDEVRLCRSRSSTGAVPVLEAGGRKFAGWNLARMFDQPTVRGSYLLMRVTHDGIELPLALAVGRCLLVGPSPATTPLPPGLFRERRSALWACFSVESVNAKLPGPTGLCLDPLRLWTRGELEQSVAALANAGDVE